MLDLLVILRHGIIQFSVRSHKQGRRYCILVEHHHFGNSATHSRNHPHTHPLTHSHTHPPIHSSHSVTQTLSQLVTHSVTQSLSHSVAQSVSQSLTHSVSHMQSRVIICITVHLSFTSHCKHSLSTWLTMQHIVQYTVTPNAPYTRPASPMLLCIIHDAA